MKVLKKRTVTFRPQASVKAMLAELDSLLPLVKPEMTLEDVINAALQSYLPPLIKHLRMKLDDARLKTLAKAEAFLRGDKS